MHSLSSKDMVNSVASSIIGDRKEHVSIYRIGSTSVAKERSFRTHLSDVDLLVIAKNDSLNDYVSHFNTLVNLDASGLDTELLEIFWMSPDTAHLYLSCLSTVAGAISLYKGDLVVGEEFSSDNLLEPSADARISLYRARMYDFYLNALRAMPYADTSKARKVAKNLLRAAKVAICANADAQSLASYESELFEATSFKDIQPLYKKVIRADLEYQVFDDVLSTGTTKDWPSWMMAQNAVIDEIPSLLSEFTPGREYVVLSTTCRILQDMLVLGVKNVLNEHDPLARDELIYEFANEATSVIVKLALEGVDELADFDTGDTPSIVKTAYDTIIDHLKGDTVKDVLFASSVVLLEYALKRSIIYINKLTLSKSEKTIAL